MRPSSFCAACPPGPFLALRPWLQRNWRKARSTTGSPPRQGCMQNSHGLGADPGPGKPSLSAASLGVSTIATLRNPLNLLNRLDDIAQDIEYMQLVENVWKVIDTAARSLGSGFELSERLNRYVCDYCNTANPPGEPRCIACGAPLGDIQPDTCSNCGFIVTRSDKICPNCGKPL